MTSRINVQVTCDLDGRPDADTYRLTRSVRGGAGLVTWEIDLCADHGRRLMDLFTHARVVKNPKIKPRSRSVASRAESAAIRARAAADGVQLSPKGRIPAQVKARYGNR